MENTKESNLFCLVMAGGKGTRFWPESTSAKPKQYLSLTSEKSLLSETLTRFEKLVPADRRYIVTVKEQEALAKENSVDQVGDKGLIFEPAGRNTAPCILLSLAALIENGADENDIVMVVPSDHVIINHEKFRQTMSDASMVAATEDKIVIVGITPHCPHTGYGYIQKGSEAKKDVFDVAEFKEKPNLETAKEYLASGDYFWNAGMFVGKIKVFLEEFAEYAPEAFKQYNGLRSALNNDDELAAIYNQIPEDSIDYAIMEKSKRVSVVPALFDWNDLGSWDALEEVIEKKENNTITECRDYYVDNANGNIVFAPNKYVSLINVNDLIVVSNDKTVLVLPKKDSQKVKEIVNSLKSKESFNDLI
jgi:mannose-1-phosphate guanylyltransferase